MFRDESGALLKGATYASDGITEGAALVATANRDEADLPAGANAAGFIGFAKYDGNTGEFKPLHISGGIAVAKAAGAIGKGQKLIIADATGRVKAGKQGLTQVDVALVVAADKATLTLPYAVRLVSVLVTTGTVTGNFGILPKNVAPTVTKTASLNAAGTQVSFLAADAVTEATIEYEVLENIVGEAAEAAGAADELFPVYPLHGQG